jgi:uncharacterized protein
MKTSLRRAIPVRYIRSSGAVLAAGTMLLTACGNGGESGAEGDGGGQSIQWTTSDVGSYGYRVSSFMVDFLNRDIEDAVFTVHPYPDTTADMKAVMDGEAEIAYTADVGMQAWDEAADEEWEDYEPGEGGLVHTFYAYPMESFLVVEEGSAGDYESWADADGVEGFYTPAGYMNWLNMGRMFDAMGYDFNHVEIDSSTVADALNDGSIETAGAYTTAGESLPTYWQEADPRVDVEAVPMSDDEIAAIEDAGLEVASVDPEVGFGQDFEADEALGVPILFGFNARADMDEDLVLGILESMEEHVEELVELDPGFAPLAEDFVGTQTAAVSAVPDVPVHPGLATFLEERDAWDDSWEIAD